MSTHIWAKEELFLRSVKNLVLIAGQHGTWRTSFLKMGRPIGEVDPGEVFPKRTRPQENSALKTSKISF